MPPASLTRPVPLPTLFIPKGAFSAEESVSPNSVGSTPGRRKQTLPLQENDSGLTPADSPFV